MAYKSLGNAIRESVFSKKDAPTMLPDAMVEKLGLGEDDILSMEDLGEARGDATSKSEQMRAFAVGRAQDLVTAINDVWSPDPDSAKYEGGKMYPKRKKGAAPGFAENPQYKKDEANVVKELTKIVSALSKLTKQAHNLRG